MDAPEPTLSQQLESALEQINLGSLRHGKLGSLTNRQKALWRATIDSLKFDVQNLQEFADKASFTTLNSTTRIQAGMQHSLDVIDFLNGHGGKIYLAAVTREEHEAHAQQYYADTASKKKMIRNLLILADLSRLSMSRAHAAKVNTAINQEIREANQRVSNDSEYLTNLLKNERLLENRLSSLNDEITKNDEQYELLNKELQNCDELFEGNQVLHQQTESLLDPNNKPTSEQVSKHRATLIAELEKHQEAIKELTAAQLEDDGQAQSNLQKIKHDGLVDDLRLDLVLMAQAMNDLEAINKEFQSARMAPAPKEGSKFSSVIKSLADLGIIDHGETHDEVSLAKHCGHCLLFDKKGRSVPSHQRSNATSFMQISRDERLIHKDGIVFLVRSSMTDQEFDKLSHEQTKVFRHQADSRRQAIPSLTYKYHLENARKANRLKNKKLIAELDERQKDLNVVRSQIDKASKNLKTSIEVYNNVITKVSAEAALSSSIVESTNAHNSGASQDTSQATGHNRLITRR